MARRSYFAKANKGKAAEVFFKNLADSSRKDRKKRELARVRDKRAHQRLSSTLQRSRIRERDAQVKTRMRIAERREREAHMERKRDEKDQKKYEVVKARVKIVCEKYKIDEICCDEIIQEAIDAEVAPGSIEKTLIQGRVEKWIARADALLEEDYQLKLDIAVSAVSKDLHPDCVEECREEIIKARPDLNKIESHPIFDRYVEISKLKFEEDARQEEYAKKVDSLYKKILAANFILHEFSNDLLEEILDTKPPLENFSKSDVLQKYIKMSSDRKNEVKARLSKYLSKNLYE